MKWYLKALKQFTDFKGRSGRKEYWNFAIINSIILCIIQLLADGLESKFLFILSILFSVAILIPSLAVAVRRLHDTNKNGIYILICALIPIIGLVWLLYLLTKEGDETDNEYGPSPKIGLSD